MSYRNIFPRVNPEDQGRQQPGINPPPRQPTPRPVFVPRYPTIPGIAPGINFPRMHQWRPNVPIQHPGHHVPPMQVIPSNILMYLLYANLSLVLGTLVAGEQSLIIELLFKVYSNSKIDYF